MDEDSVITVSYTVEKKNNEQFRGAFDRSTAILMWEKGLNLPAKLIHGIALNQSTDRAFLIDFDLHEPIKWEWSDLHWIQVC